MRPKSFENLARQHEPKGRCNVWEWARDNLDYSRAKAYETELKGPYNPEFMPYWKEPAECVTDRSITEVWVLKCARAGASENILLNPIRFCVARRPQPALYVSGQEQSVQRMMEKRIKLGFKLSRDTSKKYNQARSREYEIFFDDMDLMVTWPKNKMAFKQSGYSLILADEVSTWPEYSTEMLRKRTANWSFPTLIGISSPDPQAGRASDEDPIFQEYEQTDQRRFFVKDPDTGSEFTFEMGWKNKKTGVESKHGLKWEAIKDDEGRWDLDAVRSSAYYVTPDGTRIDEAHRWEIVKDGRWVPTSNGREGKRGYHINAFYMPWFSFGDVAVSFIEALGKSKAALKTWIYEWLAEPWYEEKETIEIDRFDNNRAEYQRSGWFTECETYKDYAEKTPVPIMTVDVQKDYFYWMVRLWTVGGGSGLVEWGNADRWES